MEKIILATDIGNSTIVMGFPQPDGKYLKLVLPTSTEKTSEHYQQQIREFLLEQNISVDAIQDSIISSVVPAVTHLFAAAVASIIGKEPLVIGPEHFDWLPIHVTNTSEIGTDLVCNAVAARQRTQSATIVVDFGTALTFTTINGKGEIVGVAIAPGLGTAVSALSRSTAKLPEVPLAYPKTTLGKDTVEAIQAGVLIGYKGLVQELVTTIKRELAEETEVFATGGLYHVIEGLDGFIDHTIPSLTLEGLQHIYYILPDFIKDENNRISVR